jgi:hypothetical protein
VPYVTIVVNKNPMKKKITLIVACLIVIIFANGQVVYEHTSRKSIYDFLDELANSKLIEINSAIKPYSRTFIAEKLQEVSGKQDQLNKRQQKELEFYMKDYRLELQPNTRGMKPLNLFPKNDHIATALNPLGLHYKDSIFTATLRPVWGIDYYTNSNGSEYHRWGGLEAFGYITENLGLYTSLRDNYESAAFTSPEFFNQNPGAPEKNSPDGGLEYSEARGGFMASWKWGAVGIVKDHNEWGNNYNGSNILSGRTPSFGQLKLQLTPIRWFEFNYFHGWLVSEVVDSSRSYWDNDAYRAVFYPKYIAANMFTFRPVRHLEVSIGNSIVYSDMNVHAAYLVPFLFYKSVDHTLNATNSAGQTGQNSQLFLDFSSRNIKNLHLFLTIFVDEFSMSRVTEPDEYNFLSWKGGFRLSNWPLQNVILTGEYTYTLPMTYQHNIATTTFESNLYNMGHYLRDNSQEVFVSLRYRPIRGLTIDLSYELGQHYNDYIYNYDPDVTMKPVMQDLTWRSSNFSLTGKYEFLNNAYAFVGLIFGDVKGYDVDNQTSQYYLDKYSPGLFQGQTTTIQAGFNIGF